MAVIQYDLDGQLIQKFDSITSASIATSVPMSNITRNCKKKARSAGGFQWAYADEPSPGAYIRKGGLGIK